MNYKLAISVIIISGLISLLSCVPEAKDSKEDVQINAYLDSERNYVNQFSAEVKSGRSNLLKANYYNSKLIFLMKK